MSEVFNIFVFTNVANDIGKGVSFDEKSHPSICKIKEKMNPELSFNFSLIEEHTVGKICQCRPVPSLIELNEHKCLLS